MKRKLIFLATEDWFVRSHFMPLLRRARAEGFEVAVAARNSGALEGLGVRLIETPFRRGGLSLGAMAREALSVRAMMRRERPDILHVIALKPILVSLLAGAGGAGRVFAVTGRGYLGARARGWKGAALSGVARVLRGALDSPRALLMVENEADRRWAEAGRPLPDARVALMPGAGVEASAYAPIAPPPTPPVVVGVASRLVWSKGVDVAVAALTQARAQGAEIALRIAGGPDPGNPEHVADAEIEAWRRTPGVALLGPVKDIAGFWAGAHVACLPSRGGEGLPRSLLEAAACARPVITTATPGCADFVRDGEMGRIVPPDDVNALARAMVELAGDGALRERMGKAAREHVLAGYTEAHAEACAAEAWRRLLA